jgi:hypothetical protein
MNLLDLLGSLFPHEATMVESPGGLFLDFQACSRATRANNMLGCVGVLWILGHGKSRNVYYSRPYWGSILLFTKDMKDLMDMDIRI